MAGVTTQEKQEQKSHELGMHTEALSGRTQQRFFDIDKLEGGGFGLAYASGMAAPWRRA